MISVQSLAERMEKLERQNRRFKTVGGGVVAMIGIALLAGQGTLQKPAGGVSTPRVVEAERFILKDKDGKTRGRWSVNPDGSITFGLQEPDGKPRGIWGVLPDGATMLVLYNKKGKPSIELAVDAPERTRRLVIYGKHRQIRGMWAVTPDGSVSMGLLGTDGTPRGAWTVDSLGGVGLSLADKHGTERSKWIVSPDGSMTALSLHDNRGNILGMWAATSEGQTTLSLHDKHGTQRGVFLLAPEGPALVLSDQQGNDRVALSCVPGGLKEGIATQKVYPAIFLFDAKKKIIFSAP